MVYIDNKHNDKDRQMTTKIIGTGRCIPDRIVTNDDLSTIVDTNDEWIKSRTGIRERRIAETESTVSMAVCAAKNAIADAGIDENEIDLIIVATSTPDEVFPNTACRVQSSIANKHAMCFDLNAACSGFLYALTTAHAYIKAGMIKTALLVGSECISKLIDWKDRSTCVLFGDGAGAVVVTASEEGLFHCICNSDGTKADVIKCDAIRFENFICKKEWNPYMFMDGQEVFKFAVKTVPSCISNLLDDTGIKVEEITYFLLHQANERIISSVAKRLNVSIDKFPMNMGLYGNTSAASLPILLDEWNRSGNIKQGDKIILSGFGAGLTWGAALLTW